MVKEFVNQWDKNKEFLRETFKNLTEKSLEYKDILNFIIEDVINHDQPNSRYFLDTSNLVKIDHGDYQGTQIYLIPITTYQPSIYDYYFTHNYYGSCSYCDTLLNVWDYDVDEITKVEVDKLMTLSLHILQRFKPLAIRE